MVTISFDITDRQNTVLTRQNAGKYPTNAEFIRAHLAATFQAWVAKADEQEENDVLDAFKAAPNTATKAEILAATVVR